MRRLPWLALLLIAVAVPAPAAEPKCPLAIEACVVEFSKMREKPWLGVQLEVDSTGVQVVQGTLPGSASEAAGLKAGDIFLNMREIRASERIAGRAGWGPMKARVKRDGKELQIDIVPQDIPEDVLAKMIGVHLIEGHFAYMHNDEHKGHTH